MNETPSHFPNPKDAFLKAFQQYPSVNILELETPENRAMISFNYFLAGYNYLATSCSNKNLREHARIASLAFQRGMMSFRYTDSIGISARNNNITLVSEKPSILNVGFPGDIRNGLDAQVYMTQDFVGLAQTNPLDALAHVAFAISCVRDFASHRRWVDWENFSPRAQAAASELILDFLPGDEYWRLSSDIVDMAVAFPHGLRSLDRSMIYTRVSELPLYGNLI